MAEKVLGVVGTMLRFTDNPLRVIAGAVTVIAGEEIAGLVPSNDVTLL